jgi:predicted nuclease of predicted toxin-antitoxin system
MADRVILAITRGLNAIIWTQDSDFEKMDRVKYRAAKR